jgi:CheY-like chemotaxis protein
LARTVLLADDSVTAQNMGRRILIDAGYEVVTVNNGSAALKKVHESRPDLIVLDVYMPGYGGLEVCQRLKETEETAKIPILLTVGKMEPFKPEEARRARADGHIVKPFEASELLAALTRLEDRIVPKAEPSRGRKGRSDKKLRLWRGGDPAVSYDDTQSDKIAYLAEVKQRRSDLDGQEHLEKRENPFPTGGGDSRSDQLAASSAEEEIAAAPVPKPPMPMPMSVYAAEQLQELPVVAEASAQESGAGDDQAQSGSPEQSLESSGPQTSTGIEATYAAPCATESAPVEHAPSAVAENPPASVAEGEPAQESSVASAESASHDSAPEAEDVEDVRQAGAEVPAEEPSQKIAAAGRWVAENVELTPEEAALELEREMRAVRVQSEPTADSAPPAIEASAAESAPVETPVREENGATFAAAASASAAGTVGISIPEAEAEPSFPAEAAAAWENWQHIRDSVMGSQSAVRLSESVADATEAKAPERVAGAEQDSVSTANAESGEASADTDADNAVLSSIVDSVLAELKPKLMREIAKKLKK